MAREEARKIVLTGVSRGLGRAMTEEFIARGHIVAGCARSRKSLEGLEPFPAPNRFDAVDVTDAAEVRRWAESVLGDFGVPDLLVNNAAIINPNAPLWQVPPEEFSRVVDTNIKGVFNVIRAFVPAMVERNHGVIVNFSSGWGRSASQEVAPYCATKWAIEGMTMSFAMELPSGMAAVPLNPGIIDTDMLRSTFADSAGDYPKPEDWAKRAVPYLLRLRPSHNGRQLTVPNSLD